MLSVLSKMKDLSRLQAVTNTVKVVISRKLYRIVAILQKPIHDLSNSAISDDLKRPLRSRVASFFKRDFLAQL